MHEAVLKNLLADHAGAVGNRHQRHDLGLQIGGKAGIGRGGDVLGAWPHSVHVHLHAARRGRDLGTTLGQDGIQGGNGVGKRTHQLHLAAGDRDGNGIGAGLDAVGHHAMRRAVQARDALHRDLAAAQAPYLGPHGDQAVAQVDDLRLARGIDDAGGAFGEGRRHQRGLGGADADEGENNLRALQAARCGGADIAFGEVDLRAHRFQRLQVQLHGTRADGTAAGQRHLGFAHARHQRRQHLERGAHLAHHVIAGEDRRDLVGGEAHGVAFAKATGQRHLHLDPEADQQLGHGAHIGQAGHIGQGQGLRRQQRRRHQLQGGILGAANGDFPLEGVAAADANSVHGGCCSGQPPSGKAGLFGRFRGGFRGLCGIVFGRGGFAAFQVGPKRLGQLFGGGFGHVTRWKYLKSRLFFAGPLGYSTPPSAKPRLKDSGRKVRQIPRLP